MGVEKLPENPMKPNSIDAADSVPVIQDKIAEIAKKARAEGDPFADKPTGRKVKVTPRMRREAEIKALQDGNVD